MKIAALDFETANWKSGSICAVGIVTYENGLESGHFSSLIKPHSTLRFIPPGFTAIHGIELSDLSHSPELPDIWERLYSLLSDSDLVVCHNAAFDIPQLRSAVNLYGLMSGDFPYLCTLQASRRLYPGLPNHKLNTMADFIRHPLNHHDALDDARVAGALLVHMMRETPLEEWTARHRIAVRRFLA